jgi:hypothetical protein
MSTLQLGVLAVLVAALGMSCGGSSAKEATDQRMSSWIHCYSGGAPDSAPTGISNRPIECRLHLDPAGMFTRHLLPHSLRNGSVGLRSQDLP